MYFLYKMGISHCHVSLPEGRTLSWGVGYFYQILSCHYSHLDVDWSGLNGHATPGLAKLADFFGFAHQLMIFLVSCTTFDWFQERICAKHVSNNVGFWKNNCLKRFLIILLRVFLGARKKHTPTHLRCKSIPVLYLIFRMSRVTYLGCIVFFMVHVGWILG